MWASMDNAHGADPVPALIHFNSTCIRHQGTITFTSLVESERSCPRRPTSHIQ